MNNRRRAGKSAERPAGARRLPWNGAAELPPASFVCDAAMDFQLLASIADYIPCHLAPVATPANPVPNAGLRTVSRIQSAP